MIAGSLVDNATLLAFVLAAAILVVIVFRRSERVLLASVLIGLCFVPVWVASGVGPIFINAGSGVILLAIIALLPAHSFRISALDGLVLFLLICAIGSMFLGNQSVALTALVRLILYSIAGYVLGRLLVARMGQARILSALSIAMLAVALVALIEGLTGFNPFVLIPPLSSEGATWIEIQSRGGVNRVEGAFGHSIALGGALAMTIPLLLATRFRSIVKIWGVVLILAVVALTLSRIGIITSVIGLVLSIIFSRGALSTRTKGVLSAALVAVAAVALPLTGNVFRDAGEEASGSAEYRGDLLSLVSRMNLIGVSPSASRDASGTLSFGGFRSIDSQLILTGLQNGLLPLGATLIALVAGIITVIRGRANPATIAVVAQIPAFATVALITQYATFVWIIVGIAGSLAARSDSAPDQQHAFDNARFREATGTIRG